MLARELEETKLSAHQKIRPDGDWFRIEAMIQDTWQLQWWLLAKAGDLVVMEPTELGSSVEKKLSAAMESYRQHLPPIKVSP